MATTESVSQSFSSVCDWACNRSGEEPISSQISFFILTGFSAPKERFLISQGAFSSNQFKVFIETCEIIKSAFVTDLLAIHPVFDQELACMAHPQLKQIASPGFAGVGLEETTKGIGTDIGYGCNFLQGNGAFEVQHAISVNPVYPLVPGCLTSR